MQEITKRYLETLDKNNLPKPQEIETELLKRLNQEFDIQNSQMQKHERFAHVNALHPSMIADVIQALYPIKLITYDEKTDTTAYDVLALYQDKGKDEGIYVTDEAEIHRLIQTFSYTITTKDITEVYNMLKRNCDRTTRCSDPDLIAVNNGIFHYKTKKLLPFTPELVFTAKSRVDYKEHANNPVFKNPEDGTIWDVESWMAELSDDPGVVNLLWEILGAVIRPNVKWGKSAWFYSNTGNNGKGTLCELMRNLCGAGSYASISLNDCSKEFALEPLINVSAIIVDENDVGTYIDRAANLKAIITGDVIQINRKYKVPIAVRFHGFMVQCLNEYPRVKDKSDSFYRRQLFVPFHKCFTGQERKYIKADYLKDPAVLEYVLHRILHMDYYELSEPEACKNALEEYKEINDPIRQFFSELEGEFVWDLLPFPFLYGLYKQWFKLNAPSGSIQSQTTFVTELLSILKDFPDWYCKDRNYAVHPGKRMEKPEHLIFEYDLKDWMNPFCRNSENMDDLCHPVLKVSYKGLLRA